MVNKKLLCLSLLFLMLSAASHFILASLPDELTRSIRAMEEIDNGILQYHIDSESAELSTVTFSGWALLEGHSTAVTNAVLCITGAEDGEQRFCFTEKAARPDVSAAFGDSLYEGAGFLASFCFDGMPQGRYTAALYEVDSEQQVYASQILFEIEYSNGTARLFSAEAAG